MKIRILKDVSGTSLKEGATLDAAISGSKTQAALYINDAIYFIYADQFQIIGELVEDPGPSFGKIDAILRLRNEGQFSSAEIADLKEAGVF